MAIKHSITLSTTEPNNEVGVIKIRQADEQTQTLEVQITENGVPKSYQGLAVYFCAKLGQTAGLGIIEQKLKVEEMTNPANGKMEYTMRAEDWQILGRQKGYFSFRKMKDEHEFIEQFTTRDFTFDVIKSVYSDGLKEVKKDGSTYVWTIEELIRLFKEYMASGKSDWEEFVEQNREILESVDPGGKLIGELIDARRPFGGEAYATLGQRLDSEKAEVSAQLAQNATQLTNFTGDGIADDTASIQNAINSIDKRGKILFPKGKTLKITSTIIIPSNKEIVIDGNGSSIYSFVRDRFNPAVKLDARITGDTVDDSIPSTCRIENLTIIGGSPTNQSHPTLENKGSANGFEAYDAHRLQMDNVKIFGFDKAGLYLNNSYYVSLKNVLFRYNKQYGFLGENTINDCELNIKCEHNGVGARLTNSTGTTFVKPLLQGNYQSGLEVDSSQGIVAIDPYWEQNNVSDTAGLCNLSVTGGAVGDRFTLIGGRFAADFETFFDGSPRSNGGHHIICGIPNLNLIGTKFTSLGTSVNGHGGIKFTGSASSIVGYGLDGQFSQPYDYIEGDGRLNLLGGEIQSSEPFRIMADLLFEAGKKTKYYNETNTSISRTDQHNSITFHDNPVYLRGNGGVQIGGGTWDDNPFRLENLHLWRTSNGQQLRYKAIGAPTSEQDGWGLAFEPGGFPATPTEPGTVGMICFDETNSYVYFCVAPNTWRRATITAW